MSTATILIIGVVALVAVFAITAAIVAIAPWLAIVIVLAFGWWVYSYGSAISKSPTSIDKTPSDV